MKKFNDFESHRIDVGNIDYYKEDVRNRELMEDEDCIVIGMKFDTLFLKYFNDNEAYERDLAFLDYYFNLN